MTVPRGPLTCPSVPSMTPCWCWPVPFRLVSVQSRRNGENGENLNGGLRKASNTSMKLDADAYAALVMLFNGAEDAGVELYLRQGYRSYEDQAARYDTAVSRGETEGVPQAGQTD